MEQTSGKTLSAGELARRAGVSTDTIRYYERKGVIAPPPRGANGYRRYPEDALDRIKSEIFGPGSGPGHEEAEEKSPGTAEAAGSADDASADAPVADASVADDTPPAGDAGKPTGKD